MVTCGAGDLVTVSGDHAALHDLHRLYTLPHPDHERETSEEAKGFSGEAARTQSGWDYGERLHARRSAGQEWAASVTPRNVGGSALGCQGQGSATSTRERKAGTELGFSRRWVDDVVHAREAQRQSQAEVLVK